MGWNQRVSFLLVLCFAIVTVAVASNVTKTGLNVALCGAGSTVCPPMTSSSFIALVVGSIIGVPVVIGLLIYFGVLTSGE